MTRAILAIGTTFLAIVMVFTSAAEASFNVPKAGAPW